MQRGANFGVDPKSGVRARPTDMTARELMPQDFARDAELRVKRVVWFFCAAAMVALAMGTAIDAQPARPHLECHTFTGQMYSRYPHPYGLPPPVSWTRCAWR